MRTESSFSATDRVIVIGTGAAAMAALWRLCAAGARIRWYADCADIGEEAILAHALGGGRVELSFDDPMTASLAGATAIVIADGECRQAALAARARANGVAVHFVGETGSLGADLTRRMSAEAAAPA
jgi:hypothetical protein